MELKECSRRSYGVDGSAPNDQELQSGALMRIADSLEAMTTGYDSLKGKLREANLSLDKMRERLDTKTELYLHKVSIINKKNRQISAMKGARTKYRERICGLESLLLEKNALIQDLLRSLRDVNRK